MMCNQSRICPAPGSRASAATYPPSSEKPDESRFALSPATTTVLLSSATEHLQSYNVTLSRHAALAPGRPNRVQQRLVQFQHVADDLLPLHLIDVALYHHVHLRRDIYAPENLHRRLSYPAPFLAESTVLHT